jgi:hypothetical protein
MEFVNGLLISVLRTVPTLDARFIDLQKAAESKTCRGTYWQV